MTVPRRLLGVTVHGSSIYSFGGNVDDSAGWYTAAVERYEATTDTWTRLADLPFPGPTSAATVLSTSATGAGAAAGGDIAGLEEPAGDVYVLLHGRRVYKYHIDSDTYTPLSPLPLPEWFSFDVTVCSQYIYAHGGASKGVWSKALFQYDTVTDMWHALPDMTCPRRRCAAALICL